MLLSFLKRNLFLFVVSTIYFVYGLKLIFLSSYLIGQTKYFSLVDDQMISMRYAKNLADGFGLVWNRGGEHVEGITNLLWTVSMAILHLFPIPANFISFFVQFSGLLILIANLFVVYAIAKHLEPKSRFVAVTSVILTTFYYPLNVWGVLFGSEVSILTLGISTAILLGLKSIEKKKLILWLPILLGVMTLIRIDMAFIATFLIVSLAFAIPKGMKATLIKGWGILAVFLISQTIFRLWYYQDFVPNTYYLKVEGFPFLYRIAKGLYTQFYFIKTMHYILYFVPFTVLFMKKNTKALFLLSVFVGQQLYSIYVGGDIFDDSGTNFRYMYPVIPLFFILYAYVFYKISDGATTLLKNTVSKQILAIVFIAVSLFTFNTYTYQMFLEWSLQVQPGMVGGNTINTERALQIDAITADNATVAVVWAGTTPYFSDRTYIDLYGKSDKVVAKGKMQIYPPRKTAIENALAFVPGHTKWDYAYSIGKLKPDIITMVYPYEHAKKYIEGKYSLRKFKNFDLYIRNDSGRIIGNF